MKHHTATDLTDRVVLFAGGARGIGAATARRFAAAGAHVAIADINPDDGRSSTRPEPRHRYQLNLTDPTQFGDVIDTVEADIGPLA